MRKTILAALMALWATAGNAAVPTTPLAHVCLHNGECVTLPSGLEFATTEECEAERPALFNALVTWLIRRGMAQNVQTAEVECAPMGIDG